MATLRIGFALTFTLLAFAGCGSKKEEVIAPVTDDSQTVSTFRLESSSPHFGQPFVEKDQKVVLAFSQPVDVTTLPDALTVRGNVKTAAGFVPEILNDKFTIHDISEDGKTITFEYSGDFGIDVNGQAVASAYKLALDTNLKSINDASLAEYTYIEFYGQDKAAIGGIPVNSNSVEKPDVVSIERVFADPAESNFMHFVLKFTEDLEEPPVVRIELMVPGQPWTLVPSVTGFFPRKPGKDDEWKVILQDGGRRCILHDRTHKLRIQVIDALDFNGQRLNAPTIETYGIEPGDPKPSDC